MSKQKTRNKQGARDAVNVQFTDESWLQYQQTMAQPELLGATNALIKECLRTPFKGTGKPEPLKGDLTGYWSRRITREHRLVYFYEADVLTIISCRYHY